MKLRTKLLHRLRGHIANGLTEWYVLDPELFGGVLVKYEARRMVHQVLRSKQAFWEEIERSAANQQHVSTGEKKVVN